MLNKILKQAIILVIGIIKSAVIGGLVAAIIGIVIDGGELGGAVIAPLMILFYLQNLY